MSFFIGKLELPNNLMAAPIAGFSDLSWRALVKDFGAGLVFSEMISVGSIVHNKKEKWSSQLKNSKKVRPFAVQLFGSKPEWFVESINRLAHPVCEDGFDLLDINMGCPVRKVVKSGAGSALMRNPENVKEIIEAVRSVYNGPLTVKLRSGWDEQLINVVSIAEIAEENGVDAVIVHPRTRNQFFSGKADWNLIRCVKKRLSIPVIGSGDIVDEKSAFRMIHETGCDGIMIGRAALGKPWIFREILEGKGVSSLEIFEVVKKHIGYLQEYEDDFHVLNMLKKFLPKYFKGMKGCKELSRKVNSSKSLDEALNSLELFEKFHYNRD